MDNELRRHRLGNGRNPNVSRVVDKMDLGETVKGRGVGLLDAHVGLHNRLGVAPDILADRDNGLVVVLDLGSDLVNRGPADIANLVCPLPKQRLGLVGLDPDFIDHRGVRLPGLVGPLRVRDPDVLGGVEEERRIEHLDEEVQFRLGALGVDMRHIAHFGLFAEDMRNESVKDLGVLGDT